MSIPVGYQSPQTVSTGRVPRRVFYTGKNIATTSAGRSVITPVLTSASTKADTLLQVGSVLIRDPYGFDKGYGIDYTRPQTSYLHEQKCVVVATGQVLDTDPATNGYYQYCDVVELADEVDVLIKDSGITTGTSILGVTNGSFALVDLDVPSASGAAITDSSGGTAGTTLSANAPKQTVVIGPIPLALVVNSQAWAVPVPFGFTLSGTPTIRFPIAVTTGAKAATFTVSTTAGAITGGVIAASGTQATNTSTAGSAMSGANVTGTAGQFVIVTASAVTTYTEGYATIEMTVINNDLANTIATLNKAAVGASTIFLNGCAVPVEPALSALDLSGTAAATKRCRFGVSGVVAHA